MAGADGDVEYERELQLLLKDPPDDIAELTDMIKPEDVIAAVKAYIEGRRGLGERDMHSIV